MGSNFPEAEFQSSNCLDYRWLWDHVHAMLDLVAGLELQSPESDSQISPSPAFAGVSCSLLLKLFSFIGIVPVRTESLELGLGICP